MLWAQHHLQAAVLGCAWPCWPGGVGSPRPPANRATHTPKDAVSSIPCPSNPPPTNPSAQLQKQHARIRGKLPLAMPSSCAAMDIWVRRYPKSHQPHTGMGGMQRWEAFWLPVISSHFLSRGLGWSDLLHWTPGYPQNLSFSTQRAHSSRAGVPGVSVQSPPPFPRCSQPGPGVVRSRYRSCSALMWHRSFTRRPYSSTSIHAQMLWETAPRPQKPYKDAPGHPPPLSPLSPNAPHPTQPLQRPSRTCRGLQDSIPSPHLCHPPSLPTVTLHCRTGAHGGDIGDVTHHSSAISSELSPFPAGWETVTQQ